MSYKALVRRLDGQAAVFVALVGDDEVEVRVEGPLPAASHRVAPGRPWLGERARG